MKDHELEQKLEAYFEREASRLKLPAEQELKAMQETNIKKRIPMRRYLKVAACFLLAVCIAVVPFLRDGVLPFEDSSSWSDVSTDHSEPNQIQSPTGTAPWNNGNLQLTSVTYKGNAFAQTLASKGALQFASNTGAKTENISISLLADTKISGCVNANLLSITPSEGEHAECDGVYYDIRKDRIFCLACHIKSEIAEDPYYIDVCIRSMIEEYLITTECVLAGIIDYGPMYVSLDNDTAKECFAAGYELTCESLQFDYGYRQARMYDDLMKKFEYPIIRIIEYGENENRCLFTIASPVSEASWGAYVYELDTGKIIKLDGDTVGLPCSVNGYMGLTPEEYLAVNLLNATGVSVTEDYSQIIVTLPYFIDSYDIDESGHLIPIYTGQNVIVFDTKSQTYQGLLGNSPHQDARQLDLPTEHAKSYKEAVYFPTGYSAWCLFIGNKSYKLDGELLRLVERDGGGYTAVMKKGSSYEVYILEGSQAVLTEDENVFLLDGNKRIQILDGTADLLWEEEPGAKVVSASGRFVYLYFEGDSFITCIDIDSGEQGQIALSEDFVLQVKSMPRAEFLLFLNPSENRLLIAYYQKGALIFDSETYLATEPLFRDFDATRIVFAFEGNFERTLNYFYNGEEKVTFKNKGTVIKAAKIIGMESLYNFCIDGYKRDMSALIVEVAEQIAEIADFSGSSAEITPAMLDKLLDGMTYDAFEELYNDLYGHFKELHYYNDKQLSSTDPNNIRILAEEIASGVLTYVYGYVPMDEAYYQKYLPHEYDLYKEFYRRLNEGLDTAFMEERSVAVADYVLALLQEAGIHDEHPIYTGYQLNQLLETHLDEIVSIALDGGSYSEFIRNCDFQHSYGSAYYSGRTNERLDCMLISKKVKVDFDALRTWLTDVEFVDGTVEITREAGIYTEWELSLFYASYYMNPGTEVIAVGYGSDGKAYAVICGSHAEITDEQLEVFKAFCREGEPHNRDSGTSKLLEQIRNEMR